MKALIIDDEEDFCLLLQGYLKQRRFDVSVSHTLSDGMKQFQENIPDVVFLDNNLPDGLGWDELPFFIEKGSGTKFYLISAFHPKSPQTENNVDLKILEKPISFRELDLFL